MSGVKYNSKRIPGKYREIILHALSFYPELKNLRIIFRLKDYSFYPYSTRPSLASFFRKASGRNYIVTLREKAPPPLLQALFKNLPQKAKTGILGHELAHIVQYNSLSKTGLIKTALGFFISSFRKKFEWHADLLTIRHGLGNALYEHAAYIRSIPGYTEKRKAINKNYLHPAEILTLLKRLLKQQ